MTILRFEAVDEKKKAGTKEMSGQARCSTNSPRELQHSHLDGDLYKVANINSGTPNAMVVGSPTSSLGADI